MGERQPGEARSQRGGAVVLSEAGRGARLDLARYEYEILCLLIRRPGWVYTREKIMEMVWIEPDESFERTVDTHIKTIRAKLRAVDPDTDPIITHRGVGYSLKEAR